MMLFATVVSLSKEFFTHIAPVDPAVLIGECEKGRAPSGIRCSHFLGILFDTGLKFHQHTSETSTYEG